MKRRDFIKGAAAVSASALSLPFIASAATAPQSVKPIVPHELTSPGEVREFFSLPVGSRYVHYTAYAVYDFIEKLEGVSASYYVPKGSQGCKFTVDGVVENPRFSWAQDAILFTVVSDAAVDRNAGLGNVRRRVGPLCESRRRSFESICVVEEVKACYGVLLLPAGRGSLVCSEKST